MADASRSEMSAAAPESSPSTADPTSKPALFGSAAAPELSPSSGLRQRRATKKEEEDKKISAIIGAAAATPPPPLTVYLKRFEPAINALASALVVVGPVYVRIAELLYSAYHTLPMDLIEALVGLGMCFFGGAYCASIAAVEAFLIVGWDTTSAALLDIYDDVQSIKLAAEADDKKQGGEAEPAFGADRIKQKMRVAALAVRDPEKLTHAVGGVYAGWVVVQGTLRLQFARTITLGISIAKMLDPVLMRFGLPILTHVVPADLHHWLPTLLRTACKMVAVALSWYLQVAWVMDEPHPIRNPTLSATPLPPSTSAHGARRCSSPRCNHRSGVGCCSRASRCIGPTSMATSI